MNSALYHLARGDRVALYTTHCTHQPVTGNRPDLMFPIGSFNSDTGEAFRDLVSAIAQCGTQTWKPPRPNPPMTEVILGIVKSLEGKNLKIHRTHVLLLSPAAHVLHDISKSLPDLFVHQISPATIPYRQRPDISDVECNAECCKNVSISNWNHFESIPSRTKRILKNARLVTPTGQISRVAIDVRARGGCEVIRCSGSKDLAALRLGQVHTVFIKVRTSRSATTEVDLFSRDPVFNSSLDVKGLRQQLQNAVTLGAVKAHLLDVQVYHQNNLHGADCWNYTETPLLIITKLGGLAPPLSTAYEVRKRRLFHDFTHADEESAQHEAETTLSAPGYDQEPLSKLFHRMRREVDHHQQVSVYEQECRRKLPICPGPIVVEASPHEWLVEFWNKKKAKRQGIAMAEAGCHWPH